MFMIETYEFFKFYFSYLIKNCFKVDICSLTFVKYPHNKNKLCMKNEDIFIPHEYGNN